MSNLYRRPSVDASYLVSVHLAKQFQRRFLEIDQSETKNCLWRPCLFTDRDKMSNRYRGRPIDASYQVSVHLAKRFQGRRIFRNQPIRNKSPVVAIFVNGSVWNEQSLQRTFHRCFLPSLVHLAKRFQRRRIFRNRPIRNKNCLWRPCLSIDQDEMSKLYRGPSIDASYQVSVHLAKKFQRRRLKCEKLTDDRGQVMAKAQIAFGKVS